MSEDLRSLGRPWVMGHHDDGLSQFPVKPLDQVQDLLRGDTVQVARRLVSDQ